MAVSHCDKGKTAMGNRDLCKLPEIKKLVEIGCKWVFAKKNEVSDSGTEVVKERNNIRLCLKQR